MPPSGALYRWRNALSALTDHGRFPVFSTQFTRDRGLEVVQPAIGDFTVSPRFACAGTAVQLAWTAIENPPETTASLIITPPGSMTTLVPPGQLNDLQSVALPQGQAAFTFQLTRQLNQRQWTDSRVVQVQGFKTGDTWQVNRTGVCLGNHWGIEVDFPAADFSDNIKVAKLTVFIGPQFGNPWTAQKTGAQPLSISDTNVRHAFAAPGPALQGIWTLSLQAAGCVGPPPPVEIIFELACA